MLIAIISKGFPNESLLPPAASNSSLAPALNYVNTKSRVTFDGSCLKQDKVTFTHKNLVHTFIVYEINLWPFTGGKDTLLRNSISGAVKWTKNTDFDKYKYSG